MRGTHWKHFLIDERWTNKLQCNKVVELSPHGCDPIATAVLPRRKAGAGVGHKVTERLEVRFASWWRPEAHQVIKPKSVLTFLFPSLAM